MERNQDNTLGVLLCWMGTRDWEGVSNQGVLLIIKLFCKSMKKSILVILLDRQYSWIKWMWFVPIWINFVWSSEKIAKKTVLVMETVWLMVLVSVGISIKEVSAMSLLGVNLLKKLFVSC